MESDELFNNSLVGVAHWAGPMRERPQGYIRATTGQADVGPIPAQRLSAQGTAPTFRDFHMVIEGRQYSKL